MDFLHEVLALPISIILLCDSIPQSFIDWVFLRRIFPRADRLDVGPDLPPSGPVKKTWKGSGVVPVGKRSKGGGVTLPGSESPGFSKDFVWRLRGEVFQWVKAFTFMTVTLYCFN